MYPKLNTKSKSRTMTSVFSGYNHNFRISEGEFFHTENVTTERYPCLASRPLRGTVTVLSDPQGIACKDAIAYVDGERLIYGGDIFELGLSTDPKMCPKQMISMGAFLLIFPDGKYLNTQDQSDYGSLGAKFETVSSATFTMTDINGSAYTFTESPTAPDTPANGQYWLDTSSTPRALYQYTESTDTWVAIAATFVKISSPGIGTNFAVDDGVTISGCLVDGTEELNTTSLIYARDDDYIVIPGLLSYSVTQTDSLTVERKIPTLDYVTECNNRIWGCHYGIVDGKAVNQIYSCKLGDPKNWNCFKGIASDSYAVSLGSDGVFTGAATYANHPIFFKEDCIHKIYGEVPSSFSLVTTEAEGVQEGSSRSIANVGGYLFYKSRSGVCRYDGSIPVSVSDALGDIRYYDAVGGERSSSYFLSMRDSSGAWHLFVYDARIPAWSRQDNFHALQFCSVKDDLFAINADTKEIVSMTGENGEKEKAFSWSAETGILGLDHPDKKYVGNFDYRLRLAAGSTARIGIQYDSDGMWYYKPTITADRLRTFNIPVIPRRCDHLRIRLEGTGEFQLFSVTKTTEYGSDK